MTINIFSKVQQFVNHLGIVTRCLRCNRAKTTLKRARGIRGATTIRKNTVVRGQRADRAAQRGPVSGLAVKLWIFVVERARVVHVARWRGVDRAFVAQTERRFLRSRTCVNVYSTRIDQNTLTLLADGVREALRGSKWAIFHWRSFSRSFKLWRKTLPMPVAIFDSSASLFFRNYKKDELIKAKPRK